MHSILSWGLILPLTLYTAASFIYFFKIVLRRESLSTLGLRLIVIGIIVHGILLSVHVAGAPYPFLVSSFEAFQVTSIILMLAFLLFSIFYRFFYAILFLVPLAIVFFVLSLTRVVAYHIPGHFLANPWGFVHLLFMILAAPMFLVSLTGGFLYLVREDRIKHKRLGGFFDHLPALQEIEEIHYRSLYMGFVLFTVGIITGGGWSKSVSGYYLVHDVKQLLAIGLWVFLALFLNLRVSHGWIGKRGIVLSSIGIIGVIFLFSWTQGRKP